MCEFPPGTSQHEEFLKWSNPAQAEYFVHAYDDDVRLALAFQSGRLGARPGAVEDAYQNLWVQYLQVKRAVELGQRKAPRPESAPPRPYRSYFRTIAARALVRELQNANARSRKGRTLDEEAHAIPAPECLEPFVDADVREFQEDVRRAARQAFAQMPAEQALAFTVQALGLTGAQAAVLARGDAALVQRHRGSFRRAQDRLKKHLSPVVEAFAAKHDLDSRKVLQETLREFQITPPHRIQGGTV